MTLDSHQLSALSTNKKYEIKSIVCSIFILGMEKWLNWQVFYGRSPRKLYKNTY